MENYTEDDSLMTLDQKFNETHFLSLLGCIEEISSINERNQMFYVEVIRNLAEFVVYSEKFKKNYFDIFCERNTLESFSKILILNNRFVNMQLIQTSSIFLQNIDQMTKKYYILSHPFLNKLISFNFNFYDEELVDIYIAFLKSLSLQINNDTIRFFFNSRFNNFPLFAVSIKFYNHPEMMVRNAIRIIALTIFKLNEEPINKLLTDLPFCSYFANLACYLRDKILDLDQSYNSPGSGPNKQQAQAKSYDQIFSYVEEIQDLLEFFQEVFEIDNRIVNNMLTNAMLYYCYLPVVVASLVCVNQKPMISINTAQYVLMHSFQHLKYQPLINSIVGALLLEKIPKIIKRSIETYPEKQPSNYRYKWMIRLPIHYTQSRYIQEYYNANCLESFLEDGKYECLQLLQERLIEVSSEVRYDDETRISLNTELYNIVKEKIPADDLKSIEQDHFGLSQAFGQQIGLIKAKITQNEPLSQTIDADNIDENYFDSIVDAQYTFMIDLISKSKLEGSFYELNDCRSQFFHFLKSKDDNLILLTTGIIYSILTLSQTSPSLLFRSNLYPIGLRRKNLLLQKLINNTETDLLELSPRKKAKPLNDRHQHLNTIEQEFQKQLLEACNGIIYDQEIIELLLNLLTTEPPFRIITFKVICSILCHLVFNKKLECSLKQEHIKQMMKGYSDSIQNLQKILQNPQVAEILPEVMEEEWMKFKFVEQSEIDIVINEPLIMLSSIDEKIAKKIPNALIYPIKEIDVIRMRIKIFFTLRHMIYHLTLNDGTINQKLKENPLKKDEREVAKWVQGNSYEISPNNELILCNVRLNNKMNVRYVLVDQDFFILIEPDFSKNDEYRVKVHQKVPLKNVESMIDRTEPRNLIVGFATFQKSSAKPMIEEMLLYFENTHKCSYVKNKLDMSKKTSKQILVNKVAQFLDKCISEMVDK